MVSTWCDAIDNNQFATWPGLTSELARKMPKSIETVQGHLHNTRKNLRSTKLTKPVVPESMEPSHDGKTHLVSYAVFNLTEQISTDLTGRFPTTSSRGMKYVLVMYEYDSNAILTEAMKTRYADEHTRAFNKLHQYLKDHGFTPKFCKLDNEASAEYKNNLTAKGLGYQLVPPDDHRRNPSERAIQTFKNHFLAILAGTDPDFPMHLWD